MSSYHAPPPRLSLPQALAPFLNDAGLPFAGVLTAEDVTRAFAEEGVTFGRSARAFFTPAVLLWAFLSQVLADDPSCRAAVYRVIALLLALGEQPCSDDTAAYCRGRAKLPAGVLKRLARHVGQQLEDRVPDDWLWHGRHVQLVDGTTVTMADTPENQQAFPQSPSQQPGLGFPIARMVVLLSLATAALRAMAMGPYQGKETGESALLRQLLDTLQPGDVLLADRYFCSYWLVAAAQARGVDVVFRMHQCRDYDFHRGAHLGRHDHVVLWFKPERPDWLARASYEALPRALRVRELKVSVQTPGCRVGELVLVSTLRDAVAYPKEEIADLYHKRWHVELDLRAIKQALHMDCLRCKTPSMVEKEVWAHWLGYNLVRKMAAQAAQVQEVHPREVSFTATKQAVNASRGQLTGAAPAERVRQGRVLLAILGKAEVGERPDRCEPRAVKRRPKEYDRLMKPRRQARAALLQGKRR